ncbi:MAG: hypothetical protein ACYDAK_12875 [Candidatus Limnocylindrales bacterium]
MQSVPRTFANDYPSVEAFAANAVGLRGKIELIWQPIYDWNIYPTAGILNLPFFATAQGQGQSAQPIAAAAVKSPADTNLTQAGTLPAPQSFWCSGIEVQIDAGSTATANLFANAVPTFFAAANAAAASAPLNDWVVIARSGTLVFNIMQKTYYQDGPLYRFPQRAAARIDSSIATSSATAGELGVAMPFSTGLPVEFVPGWGIKTTTNFGVTLSWPAVRATASGFNARIGVFLNGWLFRAAQ